MKKASRRREIMARQKEGIYSEFGSGRGNREKRQTRGDRLYYGATEAPAYTSREKSAWDEGAWERGEHSRARGTDRSTQWRRNRRERESNYRNRQLADQKDEIGISRASYNSRMENGSYLYGEHPASGGQEEYQGVNKRRSGLVGKRYSNRNDERNRRMEAELFPEDKVRRYHSGRVKELHPPNHKNDTRLAIRDYVNRGQYENEFHPMQIYDPLESEHERERISHYPAEDYIYRYDGYQQTGNAEGFGRRGGRQQGHNWLYDDEYREGHASRQRGYGKYGSR